MIKKRYEGGCSTVVVGKKASKTGRVILGHNEDDSRSIVMLHALPRTENKPGSTIKFGDSEQEFPLPETCLACYWSEVRRPEGISFGDSFFNEAGVAVVTNSANKNHITEEELKGCTMGYALRWLLGRSARTAREGLELLIKLVETYGYFSSRTYHIADKDECWSCQIVGRRVVAKRIPDDAVYFMPNWLTIHKLEPSDKVNFYYTADLVENAINNGWYTPAVPGDYSDFDFAAVYCNMDGEGSCGMRARNAWPILGYETGDIKRFCETANKKYGAEDFKALLRTHYEGRTEANNIDYEVNPHQKESSPFTICGPTTVESVVAEFAEIPELSIMWRAWEQPCTNPYVPFYFASPKVPESYHWMSAQEAHETHFDPPESDFRFNFETSYWKYRNLIWFTELDYKYCHAILTPAIAEMEGKFESERASVKEQYEKLAAEDKNSAAEYLSEYSVRAAVDTENWVIEMTQKIGEQKHQENNYKE